MRQIWRRLGKFWFPQTIDVKFEVVAVFWLKQPMLGGGSLAAIEGDQEVLKLKYFKSVPDVEYIIYTISTYWIKYVNIYINGKYCYSSNTLFNFRKLAMTHGTKRKMSLYEIKIPNFTEQSCS